MSRNVSPSFIFYTIKTVTHTLVLGAISIVILSFSHASVERFNRYSLLSTTGVVKPLLLVTESAVGASA